MSISEKQLANELNANFRDVLEDPSIASEFFFPIEKSSWKGRFYSVAPKHRRETASGIAGLRLKCYPESHYAKVQQTDCQTDLQRLVKSLRLIRAKKEPEQLAATLLSGDRLVATGASDRGQRRLLFGLQVGAPKYRDESKAVKYCFLRLRSAIHSAGMAPVPNRPASYAWEDFEQWAQVVRFRYRSKLWPLLWLLLLAALGALAWWLITQIDWNKAPIADAGGPYSAAEQIPVQFSGAGSVDPDGTLVGFQWDFGDGTQATGANPTHTYTAAGTYTARLVVTDDDDATRSSTVQVVIEKPEVLFGVSIQPSFILIVDTSGSMEESFAKAKSEAVGLLDRMNALQSRFAAGTVDTFGEIIFFSEQPMPIWGGLTKLEDQIVDDARLKIIEAQADGSGTELRNALLAAAEMVRRHNEPTTIMVISDGNDNTLTTMVQDEDGTKEIFENTQVVIHSISPNMILNPNYNQFTEEEQNLKLLAEMFGGQFGRPRDAINDTQ